MRVALEKLPQKANYALVDGNQRAPLSIPQEAIVKGDAKIVSIGAASIVAKVIRDRLMKDYDQRYPHYGFAKHKGYPTKAHRMAIQEHGFCPIHRKSFRVKS